MKCKLCEREIIEKEFCLFHRYAYDKIKKGYVIWVEALDINWKDYLNEIEKNSLTGRWAKEVIKFIKE
ncbi:MAG: hypothetical protein NWF10_03940 [Candidatus Bathyarchaeota archaeon]|nr:hypothetical protein [Candidatus Bathyarchaeota archaeon]